MTRHLQNPLPYILALALGCSSPTTGAAPAKPPVSTATPKRNTMDAPAHSALFDFVSALAKDRPFRVASLSEQLGLSFKHDRSVVNPYFRVYKSSGTAKAPGDAVTSAELREPVDAPKDGPVKGLLILEVSPKTCVTQDDVRKRFGTNPELAIPTPHEPPDTPLYLVYKKEGCTLSLGFSRSEPSCLVGVTIDSIPNG